MEVEEDKSSEPTTPTTQQSRYGNYQAGLIGLKLDTSIKPSSPKVIC
jgi:hypothetical protein